MLKQIVSEKQRNDMKRWRQFVVETSIGMFTWFFCVSFKKGTFVLILFGNLFSLSLVELVMILCSDRMAKNGALSCITSRKKIGTALMVHRKKGATQKTQLSHFKDGFLQEGHKLPQGKALLILVLKSKEPNSMSGEMSHHALDESRIAKHQAGQLSETYF